MEERERLGWPTWIGVVVDDLERARRSWGELLGLPEAAEGPDYVQFDMGEGRIFEILRRSDEPQYDRPRVQVGFEVDDIHRAREQLIGRGAEPISDVIEGDETSWAYFRGPEGNVFEITERRSTRP